MDVIQVAALAVAGVLLAVQFKSGKAEYGIYLGAALSILIFFQILGKLNVILEVIKTIGEFLPLNKIFAGTLLKMLGITYVAEFSASICQDAGYQTIASRYGKKEHAYKKCRGDSRNRGLDRRSHRGRTRYGSVSEEWNRNDRSNYLCLSLPDSDCRDWMHCADV